MAAKPTPNPPSSSSEEDASSSSDDELPPSTQPPPRTPTKKKSEDEESEADSEAESEEESGEEADGTKPASDSESESEESEPEKETAKLVTPISSRPMADSPTEKSNRTPSSQRIWTLDDEIVILNSLLQFQSDNGPVTGSAIRGPFYESVKKKLSIEVTGLQLSEKLRTLKRKYMSIAARAEGGEPFQFARPRDEAIYEVGKKIWVAGDESEGRVSNGVASNGGVGSSNLKEGENWVSNDVVSDGGGGTVGSLNLKEKLPFLKEAVESMGKMGAEEGFELMDAEKATALDKRKKRQNIEEMKLRIREAELWKETLKLIKEGIERAD